MNWAVAQKCALLSTYSIYDDVRRCEELEEKDRSNHGVIMCY